MYLLKKWLKLWLMEKAFCWVGIWSFLTREKEPDKNSPLKIGILFLKSLGIGDLIMMSPVILKIREMYPRAEIELITWVPEIMKLERVEWKNRETASNNFDLLISPSLNLKHIPWIFKAKYWIGYFAKNRIQSNFLKSKLGFDPRSDHYLKRGFSLIRAMGDKLEPRYPSFLKEEVKKYKGEDYALIAPFSNWEERQWPLKYWAEIINHILEKELVEKVILIGGKADWEREKLKKLLPLIEKNSQKIDLLIGERSVNLRQLAWLMENSRFFLGLDSGPSHFGYFLSPRSFIIFVSVNPKTRIPPGKEENIVSFYPQNCPNFPCYSGIYRPRIKKCKRWAESIKPEKILKEIRKHYES